MRNLLSTLWHLPRKSIAMLIRGYQQTLSPDHGPLRHLYTFGYCRHSPTCSEFTRQKVLERGAVIGIVLGAIRVLSCNPFSKPSEKRILESIQRGR